MDKGWEDWAGGECPVGKVCVDVQFRSGVITRNLFAPHIRWKHWGGSGDIMAWQLSEVKSHGPCAKATVRCELVTPTGEVFVGENWCANPQPLCPRTPGEGYEKCGSVCLQEGHAEAVAVRVAGAKAVGAHAYLTGHTYACQECQEALFGAGVAALTVGPRP